MDDEKNTPRPLARGFRVGDWVVRPPLNRLRRGAVERCVDSKAMQTLMCLAQRVGEVVTKDVFMEEVWEGAVVSDEVLLRNISELRKALGDDAHDPTYIETIRTSAYRLLVPVTPVAPHTQRDADPVPFAYRSSHSVKRAGQRRLRVAAAVSGIAAFCVGLLLGWLMGQPEDEVTTTWSLRLHPLTTVPEAVAEPRGHSSGDREAFIWCPGPEAFTQAYVKQVAPEPRLRQPDPQAAPASPVGVPDGQSLAFMQGTSATQGLPAASSVWGRPGPLRSHAHQRIRSIDWIDDRARQAFLCPYASGITSRAMGLFHLQPRGTWPP